MVEMNSSPRNASDRIGFFCSGVLLSLLFVFVIFAIQGVSESERGALAVSGLIVLAGPVVLLAASFLCWLILFWCDCRWRYHASWMFVVSACLATMTFLSWASGRAP